VNGQGRLLDLLEPAQARVSDPQSSHDAKARGREDRERQWRMLAVRMLQGPISADTAGLVLGKHRSIASARLGVLVKRKHAQKAGLHSEPDEHGVEREVLRYELTAEGRRIAEGLRWAL